MLNSQRAAKGLTALEWNDDVARIARMHSENMAKYKFFSHTGLDGTMVNDRADLCGVSKWKAIGENIAYNRGYEKPAEFAVERWMQSNAHRENIFNNRWKESAVGVAVSNDGSFYFTQVFLTENNFPNKNSLLKQQGRRRIAGFDYLSQRVFSAFSPCGFKNHPSKIFS